MANTFRLIFGNKNMDRLIKACRKSHRYLIIFYLAYSASLAVDGNFSTCSSTKETTDPRWWKLTMGQTQLQIKGVSIRLSPELKDSFQEFTIFVIGTFRQKNLKNFMN